MNAATLDQVFSVVTHNGFITLKSKKTGEHRTYRVWTQPKDSKFFPGKRLVGLLVGADNESDYQAFGIMGDNGDLFLFRRNQGQHFYEWSRSALLYPERHENQVEISFDARCRRCNRLLTTPESVESGIGPICQQAEENSSSDV